VTAESWSNLTVNESFADFSETLWAEHKYGQDEGDAHSYTDMINYMSQPGNDKKDLVRFFYNDKEDMFDAVTYQKGGTILNMLRNYLGRDAFYKGLGIYLKTNAFKNGEAQQLRLALEEASGKDLNWFFNQWYYGAGHPVMNISYKWDAGNKTETVYFKQTQTGQIFTLPLAIDVYQGGAKVRHNYWVRNAVDSVTYQLAGKPELVNVDGDKKTLWAKTDAKTLDELVFQYFNAPLFVDRLESITTALAKQGDKGAQKVLIAGLNDKYYGLQIKVLTGLDLTKDDIRNAAVPVIAKLAQTDTNNLVRAAAISALGKLKASGNMGIFKAALASSSLAVEGAALRAIVLLNPADALPLAKGLEKGSEGALTATIVSVYFDSGTSAEWPYIREKFKTMPVQNKFPLLRKMAPYLGRIDNPTYAQEGVAMLKEIGIQYKTQGAGPFIISMLNAIKADRAKMNDTATAAAVDAAVKEIGN
jgi:aminopeptidase N